MIHLLKIFFPRSLDIERKREIWQLVEDIKLRHKVPEKNISTLMALISYSVSACTRSVLFFHLLKFLFIFISLVLLLMNICDSCTDHM